MRDDRRRRTENLEFGRGKAEIFDFGFRIADLGLWRSEMNAGGQRLGRRVCPRFCIEAPISTNNNLNSAVAGQKVSSANIVPWVFPEKPAPIFHCSSAKSSRYPSYFSH